MTTSKYIKKRNGAHAINPNWRPATDPEIFLPPPPNKSTALPVIAAPMDKGNHYFPEDEEIVIEPSYQQAVMVYAQLAEDEEIVVEGEHNTLAKLNEIFSKYEVPAGMLSKLLLLKDFSVAEIIVDDSGSMNARTDSKGPHGEVITRWQEAKYNLIRMFEVMAYVTTPPYFIRFLNRSTVLELQRQQSESPEQYVERATAELNRVFSDGPSGTTPALERIQSSLSRYSGQRTLRYFLGDGVPNGGSTACRKIEQLLLHRLRPEDNPFTFISCTNDDSATEWMKECEEIAPYCAELDDFMDESREILKDQGKAFPYSFGLHLVGQLAAAFCPHDLDAMDESVPFTKKTLDSILGYLSSPEDYKYYFDCFLEAQRILYRSTGYDKALQKNFALQKLPSLYPLFVSSNLAGDIEDVRQYKLALKNKQRTNGYGQPRSAPPQDECCIIL